MRTTYCTGYQPPRQAFGRLVTCTGVVIGGAYIPAAPAMGAGTERVQAVLLSPEPEHGLLERVAREWRRIRNSPREVRALRRHMARAAFGRLVDHL